MQVHLCQLGSTRRVLAHASALLVATACASGPQPPATGGFAMQVSALAASCGSASTNSPLGEIRGFKLLVRDENQNLVTPPLDLPFAAGSKSITFTNIPAGSPRDVTLLAFGSGAAPTYFARKAGLTINKLETQQVDVTLMASEGFTCVGPEGGFPINAFPVATRIAGDKILLTGGFTEVVPDGLDLQLKSPTRQAWVFDPARGTFTDVGQTLVARAGHSAVYLTKSNKILIVGGANQMRLKADGSAPPAWKPEDKVDPKWEVCSFGADNKLACSTDATQQSLLLPRVMPNLMLLTADYVIVAGGAPWPSTDNGGYRAAELFDPSIPSQVDGGKGSFAALPPNAIAANGVRSGAAVAAFTQLTETNTQHYLIWGGNEPFGGSGTAKVVESLRESSDLGSAYFKDQYALQNPDGTPLTEYQDAGGALFFSTLSALGPATLESGETVERFAAIGGIRHNGTAWVKPQKDDAYLLTVSDKRNVITIQKMAGQLADGVYLHAATSTGGHIVVSGGFSAIKGAAATLTDFAPDPANPLGPLVGSVPAAAKSFVPRGAAASWKLSNDCILLYGGVADFEDLKATGTEHALGASDVYCPGFLAQ